ncbi:class I SAM-dependent methyltransferase [Streptomyces sp. NPDC002920]
MDITPWGTVDRLVVAAGGRQDQLEQAIEEAGPDRVAELLAAEIRIRAAAPDDVTDVHLNLTMEFRGSLFRHLVSFKEGRMSVEPGSSEGVLADVRYELSDLVRLLYPPREGIQSHSRDVHVVTWPWTGRNNEFSPLWPDKVIQRAALSQEQRAALGMARMTILFRAVQAVIAAASDGPVSLDELAARYGSDKWGALHFYTPHYARHFGPMRYEPIRILEIGIGGYDSETLGGESLYMWQRFFPRGLVYGLDIFAKPGVTGPRIRTVVGDQNDPAFLRELAETAGPFDIVVDDGSHVNEHVRTSYETLFPHVRPGGFYVIEDLHTAYWPEFGGELPPGSSATTTGLLKDLIDDLHRCELAEGDERPAGNHPSDISIYHNLAVLRKGIAHERGIPAWVQQRADQWIHPGRK